MERITKESNDSVIVETVYYTEETGGEEVVYHTERYDGERIRSELESAQLQKQDWTVHAAEKKAEAIADADTKIERLNNIKQIMEKKDCL